MFKKGLNWKVKGNTCLYMNINSHVMKIRIIIPNVENHCILVGLKFKTNLKYCFNKFRTVFCCWLYYKVTPFYNNR